MKAGKTEIICVIDRSGSMATIKTDAIGGFNAFLEEQKKIPGECIFTYTHFNQHYEIVHNGIKLQDMKPLTDATYQPAGMTALLDAVGRTIDEVGIRLNNTPEAEKPEQIILVILTDGEENSSHEYSWEQVAKMLKHQTEKYGWHVIFLAQNLDSVATAERMGLNSRLSNVFVANMMSGGSGYRNAARAASYAVSTSRTGGHIDKGGTSAIISGDDSSEPPKPNRATGRGIARAQAERARQIRQSRYWRRGGGEPDLN